MVAIFADLHDNLANFAATLAKLADHDVTELWIAGDLGTVETLDRVAQTFSGTIRAVAGNTEEGHGLTEYEQVAAKYSHLIWQSVAPLTWQIAQTNLTVAMYHHPPRVSAKTDIVIFGHTHRPSLKKIEDCWFVNPGTLAGVYTPATFALLEITPLRFALQRLYS